MVVALLCSCHSARRVPENVAPELDGGRPEVEGVSRLRTLSAEPFDWIESAGPSQFWVGRRDSDKTWFVDSVSSTVSSTPVLPRHGTRVVQVELPSGLIDIQLAEGGSQSVRLGSVKPTIIGAVIDGADVVLGRREPGASSSELLILSTGREPRRIATLTNLVTLAAFDGWIVTGEDTRPTPTVRTFSKVGELGTLPVPMHLGQIVVGRSYVYMFSPAQFLYRAPRDGRRPFEDLTAPGRLGTLSGGGNLVCWTLRDSFDKHRNGLHCDIRGVSTVIPCASPYAVAVSGSTAAVLTPAGVLVAEL